VNQLRVGSVLDGRLRLVEPIGIGAGGGAAWRAVDERSGREVAVRTLPARQAGDSVARARFRLVATSVTQLWHPAIAGVYEYGEGDLDSGIVVPYLVGELVSGQTLEQRLGDGPLPAGEALRILGTVADALAVAHRAGLVHGSIEPANIVLGPAGVKVTDLGLAPLLGQLRGGPARGPLAYPAPELAGGARATPAADIYSLGVVFVACLTGIAGGVPGAEAPGGSAIDPVPARLGALWAACLGADPQDRPSAAHVAVMSRQVPADGAAVPADSGAAVPADSGADRAAQPAGVLPAHLPGHGGRARTLRSRRGRGVAVGVAAVALAAVVVALTQLPSSRAARISDRTAASSTVTSAPSPRPFGSEPAAALTATPQATSPGLASASASASDLTPVDAIGELAATVRRGAASGQIRSDVGVDFENFIQPVRAELVAGRPADVPQLVATLRAKLRQRVSEGTVSTGIERMMSSELDMLLASVRH
jgi:hypothetical protein